MNDEQSDNNQSKKARDLYRAVLSLKSIAECGRFFRDLLTEDEIREFSERWYVVHCLEKGLSYREISKLSGLSTATITRVAKWYQNGTGGYKLALSRTQG